MSQPLTDLDAELLSAYLDDELSAEARVALEGRLANDARLRAELASLRVTVEAIRALPTLRAPRNFTLNAAMIAPAPPALAPRRAAVPRYALGIAAALVLVFVGVSLLFNRLYGDVPNSLVGAVAAAPTQAAVDTYAAQASPTAAPIRLSATPAPTQAPVTSSATMLQPLSAQDQLPSTRSTPAPLPTQALMNTAETQTATTEKRAGAEMTPTAAAMSVFSAPVTDAGASEAAQPASTLMAFSAEAPAMPMFSAEAAPGTANDAEAEGAMSVFSAEAAPAAQAANIEEGAADGGSGAAIAGGEELPPSASVEAQAEGFSAGGMADSASRSAPVPAWQATLTRLLAALWVLLR